VFGIKAVLTFSVLAKRLGWPFMIQAEGVEHNGVPWYWLRVIVNRTEIIWLMHQCAECGARADLLFLQGLLERMRPETSCGNSGS
jgi:hypothetical protein